MDRVRPGESGEAAAGREQDARRCPGEQRPKAFRHADDWPLDRFAVVERAWPGATVVCVAGGQSDRADLERLERWRAAGGGRVIVVNDGYRLAPFADLLYFADARWWGWHYQRQEFARFKGELVTIEGTEGDSLASRAAHAARMEGIESGRIAWLHSTKSVDLSREPNTLATGMNGGYQAVNLAYLLGAARVVLLGYSMKPLADGRTHWFGDHPVRTSTGILSSMLNHFRALSKNVPAGFEIVNATRDTALDCFPKGTLESLLPDTA